MPVVLKFGPTHQGTLYEQFCDIESQWEKTSRRSVVGRSHIGHDLGSDEGFAWYVPSHMRPFLFGCHISFCCFFVLEVVRVMIFGHICKCIWN